MSCRHYVVSFVIGARNDGFVDKIMADGQGGQIGWIFAKWAIVFFWVVFYGRRGLNIFGYFFP
jgi:hypothetical protein